MNSIYKKNLHTYNLQTEILQKQLYVNFISTQQTNAKKNIENKKMKKSEAADKRKQIVAAAWAGGYWRSPTKELKVAVSTSYRWVNRGEKGDTRSERRTVKVLDIHKSYIERSVEENPRITLYEIRNKIFLEFDLRLSKKSIRLHFDSLLYTIKNIRYEPEKGNTDENKAKRKEFCQNLLNYQSDNRPIVFMDETNFNLHITRGQGRSKIGERCSVVAAGSREPISIYLVQLAHWD